LCSSCVPGQAYNSDAAACSVCARGLYSSSFGALQCNSCPTGEYTAIAGSVTCTACPAGRYATSRANATACAECGIGTYTDTDGRTECSSCTIGSSTSVNGSVQCTECPSGSYQNLSTLACDPCPAGFFSNVTSLTVCYACAEGSFSGQQGSVSCSACPAGRYATSQANATACTKCGIGTYTDTDGRTECSSCTIGSSTSVNGSVQCTECPSGSYQNLSTLACDPCPAGFFSNVTSLTVCYACAEGSFSAQQGSVSCSACPAGRYATSQAQATACAKCGIGTYTDTDGHTVCFECGIGNYSSIPGAVSCVPCPPGRFSAQTGAVQCSDCDRHTFTNYAGGTSCTNCSNVTAYHFANRRGAQFCDECSTRQYYLPYYNSSDHKLDKVTCPDCPANANCSVQPPRALQGFWLAPSSLTVTECSNPSACGKDGCESHRPNVESNYLCAQCSDGYQEVGGECVECRSSNGGAVFGLLLLLIALVFILFFLTQGGSAYIGILTYFVQTTLLILDSQTRAAGATILSLFDLDPIAASGGSSCILRMSEEVRAISGFFGPLCAILIWALLFMSWTLFERHYGEPCCVRLRRIINRQSAQAAEPGDAVIHRLSRSSVSNTSTQSALSGAGPGGEADSPAREYSMTSTPTSRSLCCGACDVVLSARSQEKLLWYLHTCYAWPASRKKRASPYWRETSGTSMLLSVDEANSSTRWVRTLLALFLLTFNGVTRTALAIFNCIDVQTNTGSKTVIEAYPLVECTESSFVGIAFFAALMCMIYVSVPIFIVFRYARTLLHIRRHGVDENKCSKDGRASANELYVLGALTAPFRNHAALWKLVIVLRRFVLVIAITYTADRGWRMVAASILSALILLFHVITRPFTNWVDNTVETVSLSALAILSTSLVQMQPPYSNDDKNAIGTLWILPFTFILLWAIGGWLMHRGPCKRATTEIIKRGCYNRRKTEVSASESDCAQNGASSRLGSIMEHDTKGIGFHSTASSSSVDSAASYDVDQNLTRSRATSSAAQLYAVSSPIHRTNLKENQSEIRTHSQSSGASSDSNDSPKRTFSSRASILIARNISARAAAANAMVEGPGMIELSTMSEVDVDTVPSIASSDSDSQSAYDPLSSSSSSIRVDTVTAETVTAIHQPATTVAATAAAAAAAAESDSSHVTVQDSAGNLWQKCTTDDGVVYYYSAQTGASVWELPC
jgi:Tyrosine-protein kinase ephrin type A/B receptor-like